MDPKIWSELPYDLLELIASFADIDSRRALGFKPRKLPSMDLPPFRPTWRCNWHPVYEAFFYYAEVFRYHTETKTLVYLEFLEYDDYSWDVKTDMIYDPDTDRWTFGPESTYHYVYGLNHHEEKGEIFHVGASYQTFGRPEFV
jgi:hypothetical protein